MEIFKQLLDYWFLYDYDLPVISEMVLLTCWKFRDLYPNSLGKTVVLQRSHEKP